jgi:hypothetical protein
VDLEESLGTLESTRAVYERLLDLRIATPQIILNYAYLLEVRSMFKVHFLSFKYLCSICQLIPNLMVVLLFVSLTGAQVF